jgi:hypothetical protein
MRNLSFIQPLEAAKYGPQMKDALPVIALQESRDATDHVAVSRSRIET